MEQRDILWSNVHDLGKPLTKESTEDIKNTVETEAHNMELVLETKVTEDGRSDPVNTQLVAVECEKSATHETNEKKVNSFVKEITEDALTQLESSECLKASTDMDVDMNTEGVESADEENRKPTDTDARRLLPIESQNHQLYTPDQTIVNQDQPADSENGVNNTEQSCSSIITATEKPNSCTEMIQEVDIFPEMVAKCVVEELVTGVLDKFCTVLTLSQDDIGNTEKNSDDLDDEETKDPVVAMETSYLSQAIKANLDSFRNGAVSPVSYCSDAEFSEHLHDASRDGFAGMECDFEPRPVTPYSDCSDHEFSFFRYQFMCEMEQKRASRPHPIFLRREADRSVSPTSYYSGDEDEEGFQKSSLCRYLSVSLTRINESQTEETVIRSNKCRFCCRDFLSKREFVRHEKYHMTNRIIMCTICDKGYVSREMYTRHMKTMHGLSGNSGAEVVNALVDVSVDDQRDEDDEVDRSSGKSRKRKSSLVGEKVQLGSHNKKSCKPRLVHKSPRHKTIALQKCLLCEGEFKRLKTHFLQAHPRESYSNYAIDDDGAVEEIKEKYSVYGKDLDEISSHREDIEKTKLPRFSSGRFSSVKKRGVNHSAGSKRNSPSVFRDSSEDESEANIDSASNASLPRLVRRESCRVAKPPSRLIHNYDLSLASPSLIPGRSRPRTAETVRERRDTENQKTRVAPVYSKPRKKTPQNRTERKSYSDESNAADDGNNGDCDDNWPCGPPHVDGSKESDGKGALLVKDPDDRRGKDAERKVADRVVLCAGGHDGDPIHSDSDQSVGNDGEKDRAGDKRPKVATTRSRPKRKSSRSPRSRKLSETGISDEDCDEESWFPSKYFENSRKSLSESRSPKRTRRATVVASYNEDEGHADETDKPVEISPSSDTFHEGSENRSRKAVTSRSKRKISGKENPSVRSDHLQDSDGNCVRTKDAVPNNSSASHRSEESMFRAKVTATSVRSGRPPKRTSAMVESYNEDEDYADGISTKPMEVRPPSASRNPVSVKRARTAVVSSDKPKNSEKGNSNNDIDNFQASNVKTKNVVPDVNSLALCTNCDGWFKNLPLHARLCLSKNKTPSEDQGDLELSGQGKKTEIRAEKSDNVAAGRRKKKVIGPRSVINKLRKDAEKNSTESNLIEESKIESKSSTLNGTSCDAEVAPLNRMPFGSRPDSPFSHDADVYDTSSTSSDDENNDVNVFACQHCPTKFADPESLKLHEAIHSGRKSCPICRNAVTNMDVHFRTKKCGKSINYVRDSFNKGAAGFGCDKCSQVSETITDFYDHRSSHGKIICDVCDQEFTQQVDLYIHKVQEHNYRTTTGERRPVSKPLGPKCVKERKESKLQDKSSPESAASRRTEVSGKSLAVSDPSKSNDDSKLTCRVCDRVFKTRKLLINHLKVHTGENAYLCQNCGMSFSSIKYLKAHVRRHIC